MQLGESLLQNSDISTIKDSFILKIYYYYVHKGYYNIISTQLVNILTTLFLYTFIVFLFNCVNYDGLLKMHEVDKLGNYIYCFHCV